jgi:hypothetical protein
MVSLISFKISFSNAFIVVWPSELQLDEDSMAGRITDV